jgi:hypothetical protein
MTCRRLRLRDSRVCGSASDRRSFVRFGFRRTEPACETVRGRPPAGPVTRGFSEPSEDPGDSSGVDPSLRHPPAVVSGPRPLTPPSPHRQAHTAKPTPPTHSANPLRQPTPPTHSTNPLHQPTPPTHSTNPLRQPSPPTHSANPLRQPTPPARHRQHQSANTSPPTRSAKPETANSKSANPSAPSHS